AANGFPDDLFGVSSSNIQWRQRLLLFHNENGVFHDVSAGSGPVFQKMFPARGLAVGDFRNDGAVSVLIGINNEAPVLLENHAGQRNHWLGLRLVGRKCNRDAVGARVIWQAGDLKRRRDKVGGGSFLSSHDPRIILGIGQRTAIDSLEIHWPQPSGAIEHFTQLPLNRYITIEEGTGKWS
ncbi:MAG: ASPIC/UnbV domain-containing protein, partial [Terracidiphilus sp.]